MDDSRAALSKAYNAVRERYNKLRLQHRQLLKDRTCPRCQQKLHATVGIENSPHRQATAVISSQKLPTDANEIREVCDELKQLAEAGQSADASSGIHRLIPRLQNVASRMTTNFAFDDQQESLLNASTLEVSSLSTTLSQLQLDTSDVDLAPSVTGKMSGDSDSQDACFTAGRQSVNALNQMFSVVTVIETGTETAFFCKTEPNRNHSF